MGWFQIPRVVSHFYISILYRVLHTAFLVLRGKLVSTVTSSETHFGPSEGKAYLTNAPFLVFLLSAISKGKLWYFVLGIRVLCTVPGELFHPES